MKKYLLVLCVIVILSYVAACAPVQQVTSPVPPPVAKPEAKKPVEEPAAMPPVQSISADVKGVLGSSNKVKSIYYKYRGPQTGNNFFEFYIKGNKIKYLPAREIKSIIPGNDFSLLNCLWTNMHFSQSSISAQNPW